MGGTLLSSGAMSRSRSVLTPRVNIGFLLIADLSKEESDGVIGFLFASTRGFNLITFENATVKDNYIHSIELIRPKKADALAYLAARHPAHSFRQSRHQSLWPKGPLFKFTNLAFDNGNGYVLGGPHNCCPFDTPILASQEFVIARTRTSIADITDDLLGYSYYDCRSTLAYEAAAPLSRDGKDRFGWVNFQVPSAGLQIAFDFTGNECKHSTKAVWYNAQSWPSLDGKKVNSETSWSSTSKQGAPTPASDSKKGPVGVSPNGARYAVDATNRYVSWNDWTFCIATDGARGVALFHIEYVGESVDGADVVIADAPKGPVPGTGNNQQKKPAVCRLPLAGSLQIRQNQNVDRHARWAGGEFNFNYKFH
ncbi:hypothetical protein DFJ73DRAFT_955805 [Zopfochytrium polystomum]|nr:hypothetical protein DFJ73DRAFT_955805 [Zopfochytrium polystomum]